MKKVFAALLAALGLSSGVQAEAPIQSIDPKSIRFTMPTVAADEIQFIVPTKDTFAGAPQFHEDEWSQVEFLSSNRLSETQKALNTVLNVRFPILSTSAMAENRPSPEYLGLPLSTSGRPTTVT